VVFLATGALFGMGKRLFGAFSVPSVIADFCEDGTL